MGKVVNDVPLKPSSSSNGLGWDEKWGWLRVRYMCNRTKVERLSMEWQDKMLLYWA